MLNYVSIEDSKENSKKIMVDWHTNVVRRLVSLDSLLERREYWFFQLRDSFLKQNRLTKWDRNNLDQYIILPIDYGFANKKDCFFVSHFWRERHHPDPDGTDLRLFQDDLKAEDWSYVWLDWTCMPQVPRTAAEQYYFDRILRCIPMIVRDCGFEWRFPSFEPRAWVLFEVAEYMLNHERHWITDDIEPFASHVREMVRIEKVKPIIDKYKYRCTTEGDMRLVVGWLEAIVILYLVVPRASQRQRIFDQLNQPYVGWMKVYDLDFEDLDLEIDKVEGTVTAHGKTYKFTPIYHLTSGVSLAQEGNVMSKIVQG